MPQLPPKLCSYPGCSAAIPNHGPARCATHTKAQRASADAARGTSTDRGYGADWQRVRLRAFARDGWRCVECGWEPDIVRLARQYGVEAPPPLAIMEELTARVKRADIHLHGDHINAISTRPELRLDLANIQTLCSRCNVAKGNRERD